MADLAKDSQGKPWWESRLDWNLPDMETTLRMGRDVLRNIPATLSAYQLGKTSPVDQLEPDPVERIGNQKPHPAPKVLPPPPLPPVQWGAADAVNMPTAIPIPNWQSAVSPLLKKLKELETTLDQKQDGKAKVTLEQLLDPDFCDYK